MKQHPECTVCVFAIQSQPGPVINIASEIDDMQQNGYPVRHTYVPLSDSYSKIAHEFEAVAG